MSERQQQQQPASNWGVRLTRRQARPPRRYVYASLGLHLGFVALVIVSGLRVKRQPVELEQFRITLISPPAQVQGPPEPVVTSAPVVVQPEPPKPQPAKEPVKQPQKTQAAKPKPVERAPTPAKGPEPKPADVGGENLQLKQDGREFQYPEYLENIALQINRYFRWSGPADLEAEVMFFINRDGTVGGIRLVRKSPNFRFNVATTDALDEIGRARAFGPLPDGWQRDRLYVSYTFQKPGS